MGRHVSLLSVASNRATRALLGSSIDDVQAAARVLEIRFFEDQSLEAGEFRVLDAQLAETRPEA